MRGIRRVASAFGILAVAVLVWIAFTVVLLWHRQERVVFQPPGLVPDAPSGVRQVRYAASDGHGLHGFVVHPAAGGPVPPATIVIAFHGNADLAAWLVPWGQELANRSGATVILPEYRGYGGIPGVPTYDAAAHDARGILAWARAEFPDARIVLFGHSLGSAIAAELARDMGEAPPAALVLQSPFTSAREMAARMLVPPVPGLWMLISRVHYDTRDLVAALDTPVWVAHGARDMIIPARMGRAVFESARRRAGLLMVEHAGHNDVAEGGDYWRWLTAAVSPPVVELEEESRGRLPGLM